MVRRLDIEEARQQCDDALAELEQLIADLEDQYEQAVQAENDEPWHFSAREKKAPYLTEKVRRGLWLIVARSPTVLDAEVSESMDRDERESILSALQYAEHHFKGESHDIEV